MYTSTKSATTKAVGLSLMLTTPIQVLTSKDFSMIKATLQFDNGSRSHWSSRYPSRGWVVRRYFNDESHMENFISYIERTTDMPLLEVYMETK